MKSIQFGLFSVWGVTAVSFILGISLPIATVEKFVFFENQFSLLGSLKDLAVNLSLQNCALLLVIVLFTLIFPVAKLITIFLQIKNYENNWQNTMTRIIETIGHFSMLDVFIIALMVLLLKLRMLVDVAIHQGFYWFSASIILSIILSFIIKRKRNRLASGHNTFPKSYED